MWINEADRVFLFLYGKMPLKPEKKGKLFSTSFSREGRTFHLAAKGKNVALFKKKKR